MALLTKNVILLDIQEDMDFTIDDFDYLVQERDPYGEDPLATVDIWIAACQLASDQLSRLVLLATAGSEPVEWTAPIHYNWYWQGSSQDYFLTCEWQEGSGHLVINVGGYLLDSNKGYNGWDQGEQTSIMGVNGTLNMDATINANIGTDDANLTAILAALTLIRDQVDVAQVYHEATKADLEAEFETTELDQLWQDILT